MDVQTSTVVDREALARLLKPRTIAVVGLNDTSSRREHIHQTLRSDAEVFFVNPDHGSVCGHATYPSLSSIGRPIDAVMSLLPAEPTTVLIEEAGRLDIGGLVAVGGGASGTSTTATALRIRMTAAARRSGIALIGPKSLGFINVPHRIKLTVAGTCPERPGGVSIVSQSGALLNRLSEAGGRTGHGYNLLISAGNETVTDLADYVRFLAADPDTHTIALAVRRIRRPEAFLQATRRAAEAGKPIVMLKPAHGDRLPDLPGAGVAENLWMFDIALRQSGVTVVTDPGELLNRLAEAGRARPYRIPLQPTGHADDLPPAAPAAADTRSEEPDPAVFRAWDDDARRGGTLGLLPRRRRSIRRRPLNLGTFHPETSGGETPPEVAAMPRPQAATTPLPGGQLLPFDATMEILCRAGIPVVPYHLVREGDDPLTVRMLFPGPYTLRLADTRDRRSRNVVREDVPVEELASAVTGLRAVAAEYYVPPVVVIQPRLEVLAERFVGLLPGSELGPTIVFGPGEENEDAPVSGRMAPLGLWDAHSLIDEVDGAAGDGPEAGEQHEREALAGILTAAGRLAAAARGWMRSLDINSLVRTSSGFLVADAFCLLEEDAR